MITLEITNHCYFVVFGFGDYNYQHVYVYADNIRQVKTIMKRQYGRDVQIHTIELEE